MASPSAQEPYHLILDTATDLKRGNLGTISQSHWDMETPGQPSMKTMSMNEVFNFLPISHFGL